MSRRRIYLLRHGEVPYFGPERHERKEEIGLSEAGRAQARAAGRALAGIAFDKVVTSGLRRTVETAELVLEGAGGPAPGIESWTGLHEIRAGSLAAVPDDDLERVFLDFLVPPVSLDDPFLEGETFRDLRGRVDPVVDELLGGSWGTLLLVAHGGVNRVILSRALTEGKVMLGNLEQHPGCVNVLDVDVAPDGRERWAVHLVGWTPPDPVHADRDTTTMEDMLVQYRTAGRRQ